MATPARDSFAQRFTHILRLPASQVTLSRAQLVNQLLSDFYLDLNELRNDGGDQDEEDELILNFINIVWNVFTTRRPDTMMHDQLTDELTELVQEYLPVRRV